MAVAAPIDMADRDAEALKTRTEQILAMAHEAVADARNHRYVAILRRALRRKTEEKASSRDDRE